MSTPNTLPVTPNASPEAVELLRFLHSISGKGTLAGQHCNPLVGSTRLPATHKMIGHYPALFGQDFGFSEPGSWDGINYRQAIVDEAIRRHSEGFVITLMWHAVRPMDDEPVTFHEGICTPVTDDQWNELVTPGTRLNERWKSQVDVIAWHLKQLRYANVPVLWRPYHEMNGKWFWWGKKPGENGYKKLYRMLFDRFVHFHGLNNLLWVFNANEIGDPGAGGNATYDVHYPGHDVVDILATDVYRHGFDIKDYTQLSALAGDKPIAIGECGFPPKLEILQAQPRWAWFMVWGDLTSHWKETATIKDIYGHQQVIDHARLPWVKVKHPTVHHPVIK